MGGAAQKVLVAKSSCVLKELDPIFINDLDAACRLIIISAIFSSFSLRTLQKPAFTIHKYLNALFSVFYDQGYMSSVLHL